MYVLDAGDKTNPRLKVSGVLLAVEVVGLSSNPFSGDPHHNVFPLLNRSPDEFAQQYSAELLQILGYIPTGY